MMWTVTLKGLKMSVSFRAQYMPTLSKLDMNDVGNDIERVKNESVFFRAQHTSTLSKLDMNDVDSEPGLSKMDVVLSFSLEVCVLLLHSVSHWRFLFTQWTVQLTVGVCSLEVCVHSVHSPHWRCVFTEGLCSLSAQSSLEVCVH